MPSSSESLPRGNIRRFLGSEERDSLRSAIRDVRATRGQGEEHQEALARLSQEKERIRQAVQQEVQEIYRRGREFGELLLEIFEEDPSVEFLKQVRLFISPHGITLEGMYPKVEAHPQIAEKLSGLSYAQRLIFLEMLGLAQSSFNNTSLIIRGSREAADQYQEEIPSTGEAAEDLGKILFLRASGSSAENVAQPTGPVRFIDRGLYVELEVENQEDVQRLYQPGDVIDEKQGALQPKKKYGGFFAKSRTFISLKGEFFTTAPLVVVWKQDSEELTEQARGHEKAHYLNWLIEETYRKVYEGKGRLEVILEAESVMTSLNIVHSGAKEAGEATADQLEEYRHLLLELRSNFFRRARDELLADYRVMGNFDHLKMLLKDEEKDKEALYDYYYQTFHKGWDEILPPFQEMIREDKKEYRAILIRQTRFAEQVKDLLARIDSADLGYLNAFYALLQDTDLPKWESQLREVFGAKIENLDQSYGRGRESVRRAIGSLRALLKKGY